MAIAIAIIPFWIAWANGLEGNAYVIRCVDISLYPASYPPRLLNPSESRD
jgi:hypothetical protein